LEIKRHRVLFPKHTLDHGAEKFPQVKCAAATFKTAARFHISAIFQMAARLGLEPRQNESESFVLPLHHRAVGGKFHKGREMEPAMGFEPATACLQNRCSTIELRRRNSLRFFINQDFN
jgi:hypothetical protein